MTFDPVSVAFTFYVNCVVPCRHNVIDAYKALYKCTFATVNQPTPLYLYNCTYVMVYKF